jgi:glycosyltransferase involved in cell wall biosynthesis
LIIVNGRFMNRPTTGVERVAGAICQHLGTRPDVRVVLPPARAPVTGQLWEQFVLPLKAKGKVLWSPANLGPLGHRRQLLTLYDASVWDHPEWFSTAYAAWFRMLVPRVAAMSAAVMTVSEFSRARILAHLKLAPDKVKVVPLATESLPGPGRLPAAVGQGPFLLTVGSLEPRKNLARLLEAWPSVRRAHPEVRLVVVGGSQSAPLRKVAVGAADDTSVIILGHVDDAELVGLYQACTGFVFPSLYEGFGLPPVEAASFGCPMVVSALPPLKEVLGPGPFYVDPLSVGSLATGLKSLLSGACEGRVPRLPQRTWAEVAGEVHDALQALDG